MVCNLTTFHYVFIFLLILQNSYTILLFSVTFPFIIYLPVSEHPQLLTSVGASGSGSEHLNISVNVTSFDSVVDSPII